MIRFVMYCECCILQGSPRLPDDTDRPQRNQRHWLPLRIQGWFLIYSFALRYLQGSYHPGKSWKTLEFKILSTLEIWIHFLEKSSKLVASVFKAIFYIFLQFKQTNNEFIIPLKWFLTLFGCPWKLILVHVHSKVLKELR